MASNPTREECEETTSGDEVYYHSNILIHYTHNIMLYCNTFCGDSGMQLQGELSEERGKR